MEDVPNVIVISDTHSGCAVALCPPKVRLDAGGVHYQGKVQQRIYEYWQYFTNTWLPKNTRGEPFALVHNGDALEGNHHGAKTQLTQNLATQENIAYEILAPLVEKCKGGYYHVRGTEAHVGQCAEHEEQLAQRLGAVVDPLGNSSRYDLRLRVGPALCHFTHHISFSRSAPARAAAIGRELERLINTAATWGGEAPSGIIRSHVHSNVTTSFPTGRGPAFGFTTAAWQAKGPYSWRIGATGEVQIGASLIRCEDNEVFSRHMVEGIVSESPVEVPSLTGGRREQS